MELLEERNQQRRVSAREFLFADRAKGIEDSGLSSAGAATYTLLLHRPRPVQGVDVESNGVVSELQPLGEIVDGPHALPQQRQHARARALDLPLFSSTRSIGHCLKSRVVHRISQRKT